MLHMRGSSFVRFERYSEAVVLAVRYYLYRVTNTGA